MPSSGNPAPTKPPDDGRKGNNKGRGFRRTTPPETKFEGKTEGLKGHIYDFGTPQQADIYTITTREIAEYAGRTMLYGNDISIAVDKLKMPTIEEPLEPPPIHPATTLSKGQEKIHEKKLVEYVKRILQLDENVNKVYAIVWGQCTEALREKLRGLSNFETISIEGQGINLIKEIRDIVYKREKDKPNCPITKQDILAAEDIFGPAVAALKGKTTRRQPEPVTVNLVDVPHDIIARYREVILAVDIMYVNEVPFFVTVSRNIKFGTAEMILSKSNRTLLAAIKQVQKTYKQRGFCITHLLIDGEFDSLRADVATLGITLNTVARGEHVPEIERYIRTVKERTRCLFHTLPFDAIPKRLVVEMVYTSVFWLNAFPPADGISEQYGPRAIITGADLDWNIHCNLEFGSYVHVHDEHDNGLAPRTTGALALRPIGNLQGGYLFYSLTTGRKLSRYAWTSLPMPAEVIRHIHYIARDEKANPGLAFLDRTYNLFPEDDHPDDPDDESWHPNDNASQNDIDDDEDYASDTDDDTDNNNDDNNDDDYPNANPYNDQNNYYNNLPDLNDDDDQPIAGVYDNQNIANIAGVQNQHDNIAGVHDNIAGVHENNFENNENENELQNNEANQQTLKLYMRSDGKCYGRLRKRQPTAKYHRRQCK